MIRPIDSPTSEFEEAFGEQLEWNLEEGRKKCFVSKDLSTGGYRDDAATWPKIQDAMIDAMVRLEEAFKPHIAALSA